MEFTQDQFDLADNYRVLHETTGESYESIARRMETQTGDYSTAAKVRALAKRESDSQPVGRTEPDQSTAGDGEGTGDSPNAGGDAGSLPLIKAMDIDALRKELGDGGQPTSGKKSELQVRLAEFRANGPTGVEPDSVSDTGGAVTSTQGGSADDASNVTASSGSSPTPTAAAPTPEKGADTAGAGNLTVPVSQSIGA